MMITNFIQYESTLYGESPIKVIAYHGTPFNFDEFDMKKMKDKEGKELNLGWGKGVINFTKSYKTALSYAKRWFDGRKTDDEISSPRVIKAELTMNNPFRIKGYKYGDNGYARFQRVRDGFVDSVDKNIWWGKIKGGKNRRMEAFIKQLKKEGYDSIIDGCDDDDIDYVIFDTNQIKIIE